MNLGRQIHTLLKRQSSVYVNRLGTFKRVHTPATFDAKRHVYLPPITFIEFDSNTTEGYDFITYIQQTNQIERDEAELYVNQAVSLVMDKLTQSGQAGLDNLGELVSYGKSYVFKPLDLSGFNYTAVKDQFYKEESDSEEISISEVVEGEVSGPVESDGTDEFPLEEAKSVLNEDLIPSAAKAEQQKVLEHDTILDDPEFEIPDERKSTRAYVYAIVAVVAIALLGGLYYYSTTYMQEGSDPLVKNEQIIVPMESSPIDTLNSVQPIDSLNVGEQDTVVSSSPDLDQVEEVEPPTNHRYTIVIGTHKTLAQAYEEAEAFNKDGHKSVRVITPNLAKNLKRVVWDTYENKEERDSALRYVRKHIKTDAWPDVIR